jgi:hypothetical protein
MKWMWYRYDRDDTCDGCEATGVSNATHTGFGSVRTPLPHMFGAAAHTHGFGLVHPFPGYPLTGLHASIHTMQGFASGDLDGDAASLRLFASATTPQVNS